MKYRDYKLLAQGENYHVFNRGNGKMDIFRDAQDYLNFLKRLRLTLGKVKPIKPRMPLVERGASSAPSVPVPKAPQSRIEPLPDGAFSMLSYCLMPNHFHLEIGQNTELPISKLLSKVCTSYSIYFNRKYSHTGHVFQDQYKAVLIIDDGQLAATSAYIHQNPKVAGLVGVLKDWPYSSYPDFVAARDGDLCDKETILDLFSSVQEYEEFVEERYDEIRERKEIQKIMIDV